MKRLCHGYLVHFVNDRDLTIRFFMVNGKPEKITRPQS